MDRLSRHAHAFHRFAHHPLCARYSREVVAVGWRNRVCRGCLCASSGFILGFLGGAFSHRGDSIAWSLLALAVILIVASEAVRLPKLASRFVPAAALGFAGATSATLVAAAAVLGSLLALAYRRRGPDRSPCGGCPELSLRVCSGYQQIIRRERAFRRLSHRWLRSGHSIDAQ